MKALGFYCTNYDKTFDFLQHMNPAHVTPRVAREIFALEPELFYNLPDHARTRRCAAGPSGTTGATCNMSPRSGKRRSCAWRPYGAVLCHRPPAREHEKPDLYMSLVRENPQNLKGVPREARTPEMSREAFERTYGKDKTDFSVISALSTPPWSCRCSASRTTRRRYTG